MAWGTVLTCVLSTAALWWLARRTTEDDSETSDSDDAEGSEDVPTSAELVETAATSPASKCENTPGTVPDTDVRRAKEITSTESKITRKLKRAKKRAKTDFTETESVKLMRTLEAKTAKEPAEPIDLVENLECIKEADFGKRLEQAKDVEVAETASPDEGIEMTKSAEPAVPTKLEEIMKAAIGEHMQAHEAIATAEPKKSKKGRRNKKKTKLPKPEETVELDENKCVGEAKSSEKNEENTTISESEDAKDHTETGRLSKGTEPTDDTDFTTVSKCAKTTIEETIPEKAMECLNSPEAAKITVSPMVTEPSKSIDSSQTVKHGKTMIPAKRTEPGKPAKIFNRPTGTAENVETTEPTKLMKHAKTTDPTNLTVFPGAERNGKSTESQKTTGHEQTLETSNAPNPTEASETTKHMGPETVETSETANTKKPTKSTKHSKTAISATTVENAEASQPAKPAKPVKNGNEITMDQAGTVLCTSPMELPKAVEPEITVERSTANIVPDIEEPTKNTQGEKITDVVGSANSMEAAERAQITVLEKSANLQKTAEKAYFLQAADATETEHNMEPTKLTDSVKNEESPKPAETVKTRLGAQTYGQDKATRQAKTAEPTQRIEPWKNTESTQVTDVEKVMKAVKSMGSTKPPNPTIIVTDVENATEHVVIVDLLKPRRSTRTKVLREIEESTQAKLYVMTADTTEPSELGKLIESVRDALYEGKYFTGRVNF